jgi:uncharacterized protein YggE
MRPVSKLIVGLVLVWLVAPATVAQFDPRANTISVSGDAQISVAPDKVLITLGVETLDASLKAAKSTNDAACARILAVTQAFRIAAKDVQTDYISIAPQRDSNAHNATVIVGYTVRKSMSITLRDVPKFDAFLSAAVDSGANTILGVEFLTSDLHKYRDQARESAIKAAKAKADALAAALGQKAGKAITINEGYGGSISSYNHGWQDRNNYQSQISSQSGMPNGDSGAGDTTAPGETKVAAIVQVVFQLTD